MKNGPWRVRLTVPPTLVPIIGKANFTCPLGTKDEAEATSRAVPIIADYEAKIAEAEGKLTPLAANEASAASRRWFYLDNDPLFNYSRRGSPPPIGLVPVFDKRGELMGYRRRKEKDPPNIIVSLARIWSDSRFENINKRTWIGVVSKLKRLSNHFKVFNPFHITLTIWPTTPPSYSRGG
jgi:hypothetical protein